MDILSSSLEAGKKFWSFSFEVDFVSAVSVHLISSHGISSPFCPIVLSKGSLFPLSELSSVIMCETN